MKSKSNPLCECCQTNLVYLSRTTRWKHKKYCKNCGRYCVKAYTRGYTKGYMRGKKIAR